MPMGMQIRIKPLLSGHSTHRTDPARFLELGQIPVYSGQTQIREFRQKLLIDPISRRMRFCSAETVINRGAFFAESLHVSHP